MVGTVKMTSLRGENLIPQDGKNCDPYVKININGQNFKTEKISKNHENPVWKDLNAVCFQWDGRSALPEIEFTVMDHDFTFDDFIGYARIQLFASEIGQEKRVMLQIRNEGDSALLKKYDALGSLIFKVEYDGVVKQPMNAPVASVIAPPQQHPAATAAAPAPTKAAPPSVPVIPPTIQTLRLTHIRAENLAPVDGNASDPYVEVSLNGKKTKFEKKSKSVNPVWDNITDITLDWDGRSALPPIEFTFTDANFLLSDEFLGYAKVQLHASMIGTEFTQALVPLNHKGEELVTKYGTLGTVSFLIQGPAPLVPAAAKSEPVPEPRAAPRKATAPPRVVPPPQPQPLVQAPPPQPEVPPPPPPLNPTNGGISLRLIRCENLLARDVVGNASDPRAVICVESDQGEITKVAESTVIQSNLNPVWNEDFSIMGTEHKSLKIAVLDQDPYGPGDFLGMVALPLENMPPTGIQTMRLMPREENPTDGSMLRKLGRQDFGSISLQWVIGPIEEAPAPLPVEIPQQRKAPPPQRNAQSERPQNDELVVTVLCVSNLRGNCDPYVVVECEGERRDNMDTPAQNANMAIWNFTSNFEVPEHQTTVPVHFEVIDEKTNKILGGCHINASREALERQNTVTTSLYPLTHDKKLMNSSAPVGEITIVTSLRAGQKNASLKNEAVLRLCVVSAHGVKSPDPRPPNPYLIVTITGDDSDVEYRSATVHNCTSPQWYFNIPAMDITSPNHVVNVSLWDEDPMGFDDFLGQTKLAISSFTRGFSAVELQLEDRGDADGVSDFSDFGKVVLEWSVNRRGRPTAFNAPKILEVNILEAEDLAQTDSNNAVVHVSCDDQPNAQLMTALASKQNPVWNEGIQLRLDGGHNQLRLTLWDDTSRAANFLGEYVCQLGSMDLEKTEVMKVNLRPRKDPPHLNSQDVALLNQSIKGLGTIKFSLRLFSIRDYEKKTRDRLKVHGQAYTFVMQVADTADVPKRANYFIKTSAAGEDKVSQVENGFHPKFRKRFSFDLHYETEMVTVALMERDEHGADVSVGEVTFPVSPPDRMGGEPITAWVNLKTATNTSVPTKLLLRWRTFRESTEQSAVVGTPARLESSFDGSKPMHSAGFGTDFNITPSREDFGRSSSGNKSSPMKSAPPSRAQPQQAPPQLQPQRHSPPQPEYFINVYCPDHQSITKFNGFPSATVSDAVANSLRDLNVTAPLQYSLVFGGMSLPATSILSEHIPSGETVFLVSSNYGAQQPQQQAVQQPPSPYAASTASAYGNNSPVARKSAPPPVHHAPPTPARSVTQAVIERLQSYGAESAVVTVAGVVQAPMNSTYANRVIDICQAHRVNGFGRPATAYPNSEFVVQGAPSQLAVLMQEVSNAIPGLQVEELKGYIPMLGSGFRTTTNEHDAANMFEICSTPYATEAGLDSGQCWFYKATDDLNLPGVRYIDERA